MHMTGKKSFFLGCIPLLVLYFFCHFLLLIDRGVYWDDWTLYRMPAELIYVNFESAGTTPYGWLHVFITQFDSAIAVSNVFTFFCYLASSLLVWRVTSRIRGLQTTEAWILAALCIALPMNLARNAMADDHYSACQLLFWLAVVVFQHNELNIKKSIGLTLLSALLFFAAFLTKSYLAAFPLVLLYAVWERQPKSITAFIRTGMKLSPWLLLPIGFWILRGKYLVPSGPAVAVGYNEITPAHIAAIPVNMVKTFFYSFVKLLLVTPLAFKSLLVAAIALPASGFFLWLGRGWWYSATPMAASTKRAVWGVAIGVTMFVAGAVPYLAVGHLPAQNEWSDRHQLLLPFGTATMLVFGVQLIASLFTRPLQRLLMQGAFAVLITLGIGRHIRLYLDYERDWLKQVSIMRQLKDQAEIRANTTFIFADKAPQLNVFDRTYRFYEFSGMLKQLFGHDKWLIVDLKSYKNFRDNPEKSGFNSLVGRGDFLLGEYKVAVPHHQLTIEPGVPVSDFAVLTKTISGNVNDTPEAPVVRVTVAPIVVP
jgi:hypothetical protein